jgi:hypothetical protein
MRVLKPIVECIAWNQTKKFLTSLALLIPDAVLKSSNIQPTAAEGDQSRCASVIADGRAAIDRDRGALDVPRFFRAEK